MTKASEAFKNYMVKDENLPKKKAVKKPVRLLPARRRP